MLELRSVITFPIKNGISVLMLPCNGKNIINDQSVSEIYPLLNVSAGFFPSQKIMPNSGLQSK